MEEKAIHVFTSNLPHALEICHKRAKRYISEGRYEDVQVALNGVTTSRV